MSLNWPQWNLAISRQSGNCGLKSKNTKLKKRTREKKTDKGKNKLAIISSLNYSYRINKKGKLAKLQSGNIAE